MKYQDVKEWLDSIDAENNDNKRVLNTMQLLSPDLFERLSNYLVNGIIDISYLYPIPINNSSVKKLLDVLDLEEETNISKLQKYKNFFKSLPTYKSFIDNTDYTGQLSRMSITPFRLAVKVKIDQLGIDDKSFISVNAVSNMYLSIVDSVEFKKYKDDIKKLSSDLSKKYKYTGLDKLISNTLTAFDKNYFIYSDNVLLPLNIFNGDYKFYIAKESYKDLEINSFVTHFVNVCMQITEKSDLDDDGTGVKPYLEIIKENPIANAFTTVMINSNKFFSNLGYITILNYVMSNKIYTDTFIDKKVITSIKEEYDSLINLFNELHLYSIKLKSSLISKIEESGKYYESHE